MAPLDITEDAVIAEETEGLFFIYIVIKPNNSAEWGAPAEAMQKALQATEITDENRELIRTHHPAFACTGPDDVAILFCPPRLGPQHPMWAVSNTNARILGSHAGGIPIHYRPSPDNHPRVYTGPVISVRMRPHYIYDALDPSGVLSNFHLWALQETFPRSCGARFWLSGTMEMLYSNGRDTYNERHDDEICYGPDYQRAVFETLDCRPTQQCSSTAKVDQWSSPMLELPDGTHVRAVPTYPFVRWPGHPFGWRPTDLALGGIDALLNYWWKPPPHRTDGKPYVWTKDRPPTSNTPLGRRVYRSKRGKGHIITHAFDSPRIVRDYPAGYEHDLSFIMVDKTEDHNDLNYAGLPRIDGWANITDALADDAELFVAYGDELKGYTHEKLPPKPAKTRKVVAEGMQYLWDKKTKQQSMALLWRVVPEMPDLREYATPASIKAVVDASTILPDVAGQALYLGKPTDETAKIVVFQNFDAVCNTGVCKYLGTDKNIIKGGFVLPSFVYEKCKVVLDPETEKEGAGRAVDGRGMEGKEGNSHDQNKKELQCNELSHSIM
ncbi:hypothetical protein Sste5346_006065 [Sporothrix stenoceras]|uniref:Uncharacterized protein n=1 Tax=Sporothrix stenoceras TaxID=5173 RepID=A0ABR3Z130_9PEZI